MRLLDAFAPSATGLVRAVGHDPELTAGPRIRLARAAPSASPPSGTATSSAASVEDLHAFAPDDPVATAIVARVVLGKNATRMDDLRP